LKSALITLILTAALPAAAADAAFPLQGFWSGTIVKPSGRPDRMELTVDRFGSFVIHPRGVSTVIETGRVKADGRRFTLRMSGSDALYAEFELAADGRLMQMEGKGRAEAPNSDDCCYLLKR
jgi:hypothetical protein